MNIYELLDHIKGIFSRPEKEWGRILGQNYSWKQILVYFTIPLLFLSSFAGILTLQPGLNLFSLSPNWMFFVVFFGSLISIPGSAFMIAAMAPRFKGFSSFGRTFILISFSYTPVLLASVIASMHQALQFVNFAALVFMIYLFWRGCEVMLAIPRYKQTGFVIISLLILFAVRVISSSLLASIAVLFTGNVPEGIY